MGDVIDFEAKRRERQRKHRSTDLAFSGLIGKSFVQILTDDADRYMLERIIERFRNVEPSDLQPLTPPEYP